MRNSKDYLAPLKVAKWSFKDSRDSQLSQLAHIYFHSMGDPQECRLFPIHLFEILLVLGDDQLEKSGEV